MWQSGSDSSGPAHQSGMGESVRSYHTFVQYAAHGVDHLQPGGRRMNSIEESMKVYKLSKEMGLLVQLDFEKLEKDRLLDAALIKYRKDN